LILGACTACAVAVVQGGISGEWGGALLLAYEYALGNRKALYACVPQLGVPLGMLLATLAMTLMSLLPDADFLAWGCRSGVVFPDAVVH
jgi:hypothetical protein